ncbi:unnamed protein product [Caenorhabditis bovis]|uniref:Uncharacterized protein n=1 Tax=Caenorhabditis bovis TaxID=2654633 RepID=A0A8S1EP37_9PELO|nr:unnamed protein product [Caenorhabditis bovis]
MLIMRPMHMIPIVIMTLMYSSAANHRPTPDSKHTVLCPICVDRLFHEKELENYSTTYEIPKVFFPCDAPSLNKFGYATVMTCVHSCIEFAVYDKYAPSRVLARTLGCSTFEAISFTEKSNEPTTVVYSIPNGNTTEIGNYRIVVRHHPKNVYVDITGVKTPYADDKDKKLPAESYSRYIYIVTILLMFYRVIEDFQRRYRNM